MFKFILFFMAVFFLYSCKKSNTDPIDEKLSVVGNWELQNSEFTFVPNSTFRVLDLFGKPWIGDIVITQDGNTETVTNFSYFKDNVFGNFHYLNDTMSVLLKGNETIVIYKNIEYAKPTSIVGIQLGVMALQGDYVSEANDTISLIGSIAAQYINCEIGKEYLLKDGFAHERVNPFSLNFSKNAILTGTLLDIDVVFAIDGVWSLQDDKLQIDYHMLHQSSVYTNEYIVERIDRTLGLYEDLEINNANCINLGIAPATISSLKYKNSFILKD